MGCGSAALGGLCFLLGANLKQRLNENALNSAPSGLNIPFQTMKLTMIRWEPFCLSYKTAATGLSLLPLRNLKSPIANRQSALQLCR
jgi:hypothetical protein